MSAPDPLQRFGGKRFVLCLLTLATTSILLACKCLADAAYATILTSSVCVYIAGDTYQRHSENRADVDRARLDKGDQ